MSANRTLRKLGVGALAVALVFSGAGALQSAEDAEVAVRVGDHTLTAQELEYTVAGRVRELVESGEIATDAPLVRKRIARTVMDNIAARFTALDLVESLGLWPTDESLAAYIREIDDFKVDGKFSRDRFSSLVSDERAFVAQTAKDVALQRFVRAFVASAPLDEDFMRDAAGFFVEQRRVRKLELPISDFVANVTASQDEVQQAYDNERFRYFVPARARFEIADIERSALEDLVEVDEERLEELFAQRSARVAESEKRDLSLIIVSDEEQAQQLAASASAEPDSFAQLAKDNSQDAGSASNGGKLGLFVRDDLPSDIADVVFSAELGNIAGPLAVDGTWHIYKVDGKIAGSEINFDELREDLVAEVRFEQSKILFEEKAEELSELAYSLSTELAPLHDTGLPIKVYETEWISERETPNIKNPEGYDDPALLKLLFDYASGEQSDINSGLLALEPNERYLIVRRTEFAERRIKELDEVADEVRASIYDAKSAQAALEHAQNLIARLVEEGSDGSDEGFSSEAAVLTQATEPPGGYSHADVNAVFYLLSTGESFPAYAYSFDLQNESVNVLAIDEVIEVEVEDHLEHLSQAIGRNIAQIEESLLLSELLKENDVYINEASLDNLYPTGSAGN